ncbi:MAG: hypothetical protein ISR47_03750 [Rhodospirillales bacterium]|nr:hypothetical protein [Rhodospirillales bacterium]
MAQQAANESQNVTSLYGKASRERVIGQAANEIIFAVVGYVGSGTSTIAKELKKVLDEETLPGGKFDATIIKARDEIAVWAEENGYALPNPDETTAKNTGLLQDYGDDWRLKSGDNAVIAKHFALKVRSVRAKMVGVDEPGKEPVLPDGKRRAYILDSIRHPAEVALLRHIYQDAFILIGVVCQEDLRVNRLVKKYTDAGEEVAKELMKRDAKEEEKHGQRTSDAFHLSDYFVDNSMERFVNESGVEEENSKWTISDKLGRLINIVTHSEIVRPEISETAMHHAHGAQLRSACLSRQVGAALIDKRGNVLATGTNEVPRAGGGVYGEAFSSSDPDHRCAYRPDVFCSNTKEQNEIIDQIINDVSK